jgi:hypothetical protein
MMTKQFQTVCVFASSSEAIDPKYGAAAEQLGIALAESGFDLIYGGTNCGLMCIVASAMKLRGRHVTGVIPEVINDQGLAQQEETDELIMTKTMRERKAKMEELADAFVALPGGFGTLDEVAEVIVLRQLDAHRKPVIIIDLQGFYGPLHELFDRFLSEGFAHGDVASSYTFVSSVDDAIAALATFTPSTLPFKWPRNQG